MNDTQLQGTRYPYVVRRIMAAVYQRIEVVFRTEKCLPPPEGLQIVVEDPAYDDDGDLIEEARIALIDVLKKVTRTSGFRMCAVFGERDTAYVEPDGQVNWKTEAPSGGVNL
jgi:hypothetical protein